MADPKLFDLISSKLLTRALRGEQCVRYPQITLWRKMSIFTLWRNLF